MLFLIDKKKVTETISICREKKNYELVKKATRAVWFFRRPAPGAVLPVRLLQDEAVPPGQQGGGEGGSRRVRDQQVRQDQEVGLGAV